MENILKIEGELLRQKSLNEDLKRQLNTREF